MERSMQRESSDARAGNLRGLLALNGALLAVLALVTFAPAAKAQQGRSRGEYTMVAGGVNGAQADVVYLADVTNQELIVLHYDTAEKTLEAINGRDLRLDAAELLSGRARPSQDPSDRSTPR
jgi:hypothetical protein